MEQHDGTGPGLVRGLGLWQATALNVTLVVGAGVFITIPYMLRVLPGPYAVLAWVCAGVLILLDGLVWAELGALMPRSGGSYHFLLECYGRDRWGRLMAFLFIWQFLISGPLELGSGLVALALFASALAPAFNATHRWVHIDLLQSQGLAITVDPSRLFAFVVGVVIIVLLCRRITTLGKLTVGLWLGVLGLIAWILIEGAVRFDPAVAFDFSGEASSFPADFGWTLGPAMILAIYSYLGYYNVCYVGDEVRDPGRVIPRAILLSALIVVVLFTALHLAMLGTVSWKTMPADLDGFSLPAAFMEKAHGRWAVVLVTLLLVGSCFGSVFAGLLGYSRIPYGAARAGHFFRAFDRVHPTLQVPHISLFLVGGLMLFWTFFDLSNVINALITTRILEQFVGQIVGLMWLRHARPDLRLPFRMWLYPLPCLLALVGWLYLYGSSGLLYISLGGATLLTGVAAFFLWAHYGEKS